MEDVEAARQQEEKKEDPRVGVLLNVDILWLVRRILGSAVGTAEAMIQNGETLRPFFVFNYRVPRIRLRIDPRGWGGATRSYANSCRAISCPSERGERLKLGKRDKKRKGAAKVEMRMASQSGWWSVEVNARQQKIPYNNWGKYVPTGNPEKP